MEIKIVLQICQEYTKVTNSRDLNTTLLLQYLLTKNAVMNLPSMPIGHWLGNKMAKICTKSFDDQFGLAEE